MIGSANVKSLLRFSNSNVGRRAMVAAWLASQLAIPAVGSDPVPAPGFLELSERRADALAASEQTAEEPTVRLNIFNSTWPDILKNVAEKTNSTLVLQDPPPGRFSRADYRAYTRREAVAILNHELNPKGYRILENGEHLIVMSERTMRKHYRPAVLGAEQGTPRPTQSAESTPEREFKGFERRFETIVPAGGSPSAPPALLAENHVQPAGHARQPGGGPAHHPLTSPAPAAANQLLRIEDAGPPVTLNVPLRQQSAAAVAKQVHSAFGQLSELVNAGKSGLPAFRVTGAPGQDQAVQPTSFEVEINTQTNELLVTGPKARATAIADLLREMDGVTDPAQVLRVTPATPGEQHLARQLRPVLAQIDANVQPPATPETATPPADGGPTPPMPPNGVPGDQPAVIQGELPALIGNLRGEVTIESVPGLDVLILRGNDQDVQAVRQVIDTLEQLSAGQQPVLELLTLEHVDSAALATLLEDVYGRLATIRNKGTQAAATVAAIPIVKPNALLIIAPEGEMESVLDLAAELDQPVEPATEFQVFRLKSALASQVATTVEDFYEERAGLGTRVNVIADVRTNSLIVSARARDLQEIGALIRRIDRDESGLVNQIQVYPLESASAEELANVINQAIQSVLNPAAARQAGQGGQAGGFNVAGGAGGEAAEQLNAARSAVLEFLDATGDSPQMRKSGLLADIRVTPDPRTNSLIVTAGEQSLPFIEALIRQLDRPASATAEIKIFALKNSDASSVVELLNTLFSVDQQSASDTGVPGIQLAGATDPGSSLIPLRFATDIRTNSVIASGSADALQIVYAILTRLDESDIRQRETTVVKLKNAPAYYVAMAIQQFLESQRALIQYGEDLVSNVEFLEREIIVVPEEVSNSLLVSATPRYFEEIQRIIAKLDEAPPQVIIQAMLVEVSLDNTDEFGVELGLQESTLFDRSMTTLDQLLETTTTAPNGVQTTTQEVITQSGTPGFLFNNSSPLGNNTARGPQTIASQGLSNFALGRANADLGYGGFVFSASSANVSVLLRALSAKRTIQVLSRPQIRTLDNQPAQIQVGQRVPIVNGVDITTGIASPRVEVDDAGLILSVIPRISPDGNIVMEVAATRSQYTGAGVPIFVDANSGNTIEAPIKDITTASATVSVPTGQTIVLGGIISRSDDTLERKVPYLGDIPYLGTLFRYDSTRMQRRELLVFLTPRVIYNDGDNELIKQVEADRLHFIEHEAESIHGPLYGVPPAGPGPMHGIPPVLETGPQPTFAPPMDSPLSGEQAILPGLPADACPPGIYPPGTLFQDAPPSPEGNPHGDPRAQPIPGFPPGQGAPPMPGGPAQPIPSMNPIPLGPLGDVTSDADFETVKTTGPAVSSKRFAGVMPNTPSPSQPPPTTNAGG